MCSEVDSAVSCPELETSDDTLPQNDAVDSSPADNVASSNSTTGETKSLEVPAEGARSSSPGSQVLSGRSSDAELGDSGEEDEDEPAAKRLRKPDSSPLEQPSPECTELLCSEGGQKDVLSSDGVSDVCSACLGILQDSWIDRMIEQVLTGSHFIV